MSAPAAWRQVLRAPWLQRRNRPGAWVWVALFALAVALLVAALAVAFAAGPGREVALIVAISIGPSLFIAAWSLFVANLMLQNHPHAARLVPGHVGLLRRVLLGVGAVVTVLAGAIGAVFGHALAAAGAAALLLLVVAWFVRTPWLGAIGWFVPTITARASSRASFAEAVRPVVEVVAARPVASAAVAALLLAALTAWSVPRLLRDGDAAHERFYRARTKRRQAQLSGRADLARWSTIGGPGDLLRRAAAAPYRAWLARVASRRSGSVLGRGLVGLGPAFHWSGQFGTAAVYGALFGLLFSVIWGIAFAGARSHPVHASTWAFAIGGMPLIVGSALAACSTFGTTRREQALLMLLPGMPRGRALNRALAWRLLAQFVVTWAIGAAACLALVPWESRPFGWLMTLVAACFTPVVLLWRDWSRIAPSATPASMWAGLFAMVLSGLAIAVQVAFGIGVWPCALAFGLATIALLAWRWRIIDRAPAAFPAGRLG